MKRNIVEINQELCNGCELCVKACHEGAIQMLHGKATLISDIYCDGLGDCLPACPTGAIKIIQRDAAEYSQEAVDELLAVKATAMPLDSSHACACSGGEGHGHTHMQNKPLGGAPSGGCPGSKAMNIERSQMAKPSTIAPLQTTLTNDVNTRPTEQTSELTNWPVQLKLVNTKAEYFAGADLLIAADCTAFAYGNFQRDFVKGRVVLIGCPKLDDNQFYAEKLAEIFNSNDIRSITVLRMEVPCCSGIVQSVKAAILKSQRIVPYNEVTIKLNGEIQ